MDFDYRPSNVTLFSVLFFFVLFCSFVFAIVALSLLRRGNFQLQAIEIDHPQPVSQAATSEHSKHSNYSTASLSASALLSAAQS